MLSKGQLAPVFRSTNQLSETISLEDFQNSSNVLLYFYPKDDTPGCTIEANQFPELASEFHARDTAVLGVSKDTCDSHQAFINKYGLKIDLLADTNGEVCDQYGVWQEKETKSGKKMGIVRSTFVINKAGVLEAVYYGVTAEGHAQEILNVIEKLQA